MVRYWQTCAVLIMVVLLRGAAAEKQRAIQPKLQSIESATQETRANNGTLAVMVRGIVVLNYRKVVIEDRTGATEVVTSATREIALGDEVEVTGTMTLTSHPQIQENHLSRLWGGSMPLPLAITPDEAAEGENELALVQIEGRLDNVTSAGLTGVRLGLTGAHQNFSAVLPNNDLGGEISSKLLQTGATLRLTGILFMRHNPTGNYGDAFTLQLRTPDDIALLEGPSWWTRAHLLLLMGIAIIFILISVNIYARIEHSRYRAIAEERANIARDIHDTLAQGFAGISLQLEAAEQIIDRDPQQAKLLVKEASQLVRHSRDESHISIDILHSPSRNNRLDLLLAHCIAQMKSATRATIDQRVIGEAPLLSYNLMNNLFRIGQEAIANAVRHANATSILVLVHYKLNQICLKVDDDGKGFDPSKTPGPEEGHFGLTGIRERAAAISAKLQIESTPGRTTISVTVPL